MIVIVDDKLERGNNNSSLQVIIQLDHQLRYAAIWNIFVLGSVHLCRRVLRSWIQ